jgi:hypothetical protein
LEASPIARSEGTWPQIGSPILAIKPQNSIALRKKLFDQICAAFDMEEFKNLCFFIGVDVDELPGDRKSSRVRELILLFERQGQLEVLQDATSDIPIKE